MPDIEVEEIVPLTDYEEVNPFDSTEESCTGRVRVLQTPSAFLVELGISPTGTREYTREKHYTPDEARRMAEGIRDVDAPKLINLLGEEQALEISARLDLAADVAGTKAIGDVVGDDVVRAYKEDKVTADEFMHEFSRKVDRALEERDRTE